MAGTHEPTHYADSGFLFDDFHAGDHADTLELELSAAVPSHALHFALDPDHGDAALPASDAPTTLASSGWLTVRVPRGPPATHPTRPAEFSPPLRGPPAHSLA